MHIYELYDNTKKKKNGIIAIGYFDSVHLGHIELIKKLLSVAKIEKLVPYILTFDNLYFKEKNGKKVLEFNDKIKILKEFGVKNLIICKFNETISKIEPEDFLLLLKKNFNIVAFVCGKDFHFGHNKKGNVKFIEAHGFKTFIVDPVIKYEKKISTSLIKEYIKNGEIEIANELMGRIFFIKGIVKKGRQLGRELGFPTFNFFNDNIIKPANGVYITKVHVKNNVYDSLTHVTDNIIETYALGYNRFSYGLKIKVDFFKKIRDNIQFENNDMLVKQINNDIEKLKEFLGYKELIKWLLLKKKEKL